MRRNKEKINKYRKKMKNGIVWVGKNITEIE